MKNLLKILMMIAFMIPYFTDMKAQTYEDIDRTQWAISSDQGSTGSQYVSDASVGGQPENILVTSTTPTTTANKCLSMAKPGRHTAAGVTARTDLPEGFLPFFTVDMKSPLKFNYFRWRHRGDNTNQTLKVFAVHVYGSDNGTDFIQIIPDVPEAPSYPNLFWIPVTGGYTAATGSDGNNYYRINLPESTYQYVRVEYVVWSQNYGTAQGMYQHPEYPGAGAGSYGNTAQLSEFGLGLFTKGAGATIAAPAIASIAAKNIIIYAVAAPSNGQAVEYGINTIDEVPTDWQNELIFTGLDENTTYYIFARAKENTTHSAGEPSVSVEVKTKETAEPPVITTTRTPDGNINKLYSSTTLTASGDLPITWAVTDGALPAGLELSDEGVISGTPTALGVNVFTVTATNEAGSDDQEFSITITKSAGATVAVPTLASKDLTSLTINAVAAPATGQEVEYAATLINAIPGSGWQTGLTFMGLNSNAIYYVFARAKEDETYNVGAVSASLRVAIDLPANVVAVDYDRTGWTVSSKNNLTGNDYNPDNSTGMPEHLFTTSTAQYLAFVKPGKSISPVSCPSDFRPYFIVNLQSPQTFDYFRWMHRQNNYYNYMRVFAVKVYESNDGENFTPILPEYPEAPQYPEWFWIPSSMSYTNASNTTDANYYIISTPKTTCQYVKVEMIMWSDAYNGHHPSYTGAGATSGNSVSICQFGLGTLQNAITPAITTTELPDGKVGVGYDQTLAATAIPQATWSIIDGALPAGLTMNAAGRISGTPSKAAPVSITVKASNVAGDDTQELPFEITKGEGAAVNAPTLVNKGSNSITVEVGAPQNGQEIEYSISADETPAEDWQTSHIFADLEEGIEYFIFARAKENDDYNAGAVSEPLTVSTNATPVPPTITTETLQNGTVFDEYTVNLIATGDEPITWDIEGDLPEGLTLEDNVISGTPTVVGTFTFTVIAENEEGLDSKELSITIVKATGKAVAAPTLAEKTSESITINAVTAPDNGQDVEYAINTTNEAPAENWKTSCTFEGLTANANYYIFARAKENENYKTGAASASLQVFLTDGSQLPGDIDRTGWTVTTQTSKNYGYVPDGTTGLAEHIFDGSATTFLSLVKPGKSYTTNSVTYEELATFLPSFTVDLKSEYFFNYIVWQHRGGNGYNYLRVYGVNVYGSQNGNDFTLINTEGIVWIPNVSNYAVSSTNPNDANTYKIGIPESNYRYVKIELVMWSDKYDSNHPNYPGKGSTSGSTMQIGEFGLGLIIKAAGAEVAAPTVDVVYSTSIAIHPVAAPNNGQTVEYGINTENVEPTKWQSGVTFAGLGEGVTYYIFARAKENLDYRAGEASFIEVTTLAAAVPPTILTGELPDGNVGATYSVTLNALGDNPKTWEVTDGNLPDGLVLSVGGVISGTPTTVGVSVITVTVTNEGGSAHQEYSITIYKKIGATVATPTLASKDLSSITINAVTPPANEQGVEYAASLVNAEPVTGWQDELVFVDLRSNSTYYVFARSKENEEYEAGKASVSLRVAIDLPVNLVPDDYDRSGWTVTSKNNLTGNDYNPDGSTGMPEHLFTTATTQFLAFVKPGKSLGTPVVACPADFRPYFIVNLQSPQTFGYFRWMHRQNNATNYLKVFAVKVYESNDGENFTPILPEYPEAPEYPDWFWIPNSLSYTSTAGTADATYYLINTPETTCQYVKVEVIMWSDAYKGHHPSFTGNGSTSGNSVSIGQFGLGNLKAPVAPVITTVTLPDGAVGATYRQTLEATALPQPTWSVIDAANLPAGLSLSSAGVISGTPSKTGTSTFTVKALNVAGDVTKELSVIIAKGEGAEVAAPTLLGKGAASVTVDVVAAPANGQEVEYAISAGSNPPADHWQISRVFSGLTVNTNYFVFARAKENDNYNAGVASAPLSVKTDAEATAPAITTTEIKNGKVGVAYSEILAATGDALTWQIVGNLPAGLILTGDIISGKPTEAGTFTFTVRATNSRGMDNKELSVTIEKGAGAKVPTPTFVGKGATNITVDVPVPATGQVVEYIINTENSVPIENVNWQTSYTFTGLTLNTEYFIFARAKGNDNYFEGDISASLAVTTDATSNPPVINTVTLHDGSVGATYSAILAASGEGPITWEIVGNLPAGLTLTVDVITGTPTAVETANFTVKATNSIGSVTKELSITIGKGLGAAVAAPTLAGTTRTTITIHAVTAPASGQEVEYGINAGNTAPENWQQALVFTNLNAGTAYYIFARTKGNDRYNVGAASASLSVTTAAPAVAPAITTATLANGTVDVDYSATLAASGEEPITWEIVGTLPAGLTLSGNVISGKPTTARQVTFTVKATNEVGSASKELSITVGKGMGAAVAAPTLATATATSITINAVAAPASGQEVEYAINTANSMPDDYPVWQTTLVFTNLSAKSTYYIFARTKGNDNYNIGAISASLQASTSVATGNETLPVISLKAWVNNGQLYVTGLTEGKTWSIYTASGHLVYRNVAVNSEEYVTLSASGMYIIQSENNSIKVMFP